MWAYRAVQSYDVRSPFVQLFGEKFGRGAITRIAIILNRHLGNNRQIADTAHRLNRLPDFGNVRKGFKDEEINSAFEQSLRLFAKEPSSLLYGSRAIWLQ